MRVFIYEFVTAGGWRSWAEHGPPASLLAEGKAMLDAVCEDFAHIGAVPVLIGDARSRPEREVFGERAAAADWTVVIAPESDGILLDRSRWVLESGGRLLSPGPATIALASNKHRTAEHLSQQGIPVPLGMPLIAKSAIPATLFPAVLKPIDGCGSQGVRRIERAADLCGLKADKPQRLEQFVPGLAASVAVLCGPKMLVPLPACEQRLSADGRFAYLGGRTPLAPALCERARRLALAAVSTLPDPLGYVGVDLVLGDDPSRAGDWVIEINPRLTTSYVGLRAACRENLAAAMLEVALGRRPSLSWRAEAVEFSADGRVEMAADRALATRTP
jgi:predicted ATP-grasp superfamily ATP-dependent carboligase